MTRILESTNSVSMPLDERLLSKSAEVCDAVLMRLVGMSPEGLRAAASSPVATLVTCPSQAVLDGASAAYSWCTDFMNEPWSEPELLVRLFRLIASPHNSHSAATPESRVEPLVLLADDDPEWTSLAGATLRNNGIAWRMAENGLTALRLAREFVPDLVVLDVRMPQMNGFEVLEAVKNDPRLQTLPVMLLTGCDEAADVKRGVALRADDYLTKPVRPGVLLNRVKRLLTSASGARAWARSSPEGGDTGGAVAKPGIPAGDSNPGALSLP
jgi:CheY-like chemotaxis protein